MTTRLPSVAGSFYPKSAETLRQEVVRCLGDVPPLRRRALAALVPHAGYRYSGAVAGAVFRRLEMPRDIVLLCFHHRGWGAPISVWPEGAWRMPLGDVEIGADLAREVAQRCGGSLDEEGHRSEHSGEVQVPFLQVCRPDVRLVPVALSGGVDAAGRLRKFGEALAALGRDREFLVLASTDLNHDEPHGETLVKDQYVIDAVQALDAESLARVVRERDISMCGVAPTLAMIAYARGRGAVRAELVLHRTSFDAGGEEDRTVGYAGMIIEPCGP